MPALEALIRSGALLKPLAAHTQTATADMGRIVYDLRPPAPGDLGLLLAVREEAARLSRRSLRIAVVAPERLGRRQSGQPAATA